jgi:hypothetical protein
MLALAGGNIQRHRHEIKFDGFRVQIHKLGNEVELYSRSASRFGRRFPLLCRVLRELPVRSAIIDGEVVASDAHNFWPRALIEGAFFGPEPLKAVGQAFDEAGPRPHHISGVNNLCERAPALLSPTSVATEASRDLKF